MQSSSCASQTGLRDASCEAHLRLCGKHRDSEVCHSMLCCSSAQVLLEMQTHQERPPRRISPLECTLTKNGLGGSLKCPVTNSLDLKSPGIRASWPFGGPEVLWRSSTPVTRLECTLTKNGLLSPLECTDTNSLHLKSPGMNTYKKRGVGGVGEPAAMPRQSGFTFSVCFTSRSSGVHR